MNLTQKIAGVTVLMGSITLLVSAESNLTIVVITDDPAPDGNGRFAAAFEPPTINNVGQLAVQGGLRSTSGGARDNRGIFRGDGTTLTQIARGGQAAPDGNGVFRSDVLSFSFSPLINDAGEVAFWAGLSSTAGGSSDNEGIFRSNGAHLTQIVRNGQTAPGQPGTFLLPLGLVAGGFTLNSKGQVAFASSLGNSAPSDNQGIFRGDGTNLVEIARKGQAAAGDTGSYQSIDVFVPPAINNAGQVAFTATLTGFTYGVFLGDGTSPAVLIAREGQTAPDGDGTFSLLFSEALNDNGQVAFIGSVQKTDLADSHDGIFRGDGTTLTQIVREGQAAPDGNGTFDDIKSGFHLNTNGQVVFSAHFANTADGEDDDEGIYRGDGLTLTRIVRDGQAAPDGNGKFAFNQTDSFSFGVSLNGAGQVAFGWSLTGTLDGENDSTGIFFFDDVQGLIQVARKGDTLLGSTITSLSLSDSIALNNRGEIAFGFHLDDGRAGRAIWSAAGPTTEAQLNSTFDASSKMFTISWPTVLTGWILETTTNLADPLNWEPVTVSPATAGEQFQVSFPKDDGQRFFRLRQEATGN